MKNEKRRRQHDEKHHGDWNAAGHCLDPTPATTAVATENRRRKSLRRKLAEIKKKENEKRRRQYGGKHYGDQNVVGHGPDPTSAATTIANKNRHRKSLRRKPAKKKRKEREKKKKERMRKKKEKARGKRRNKKGGYCVYRWIRVSP